MTSRPRAPLAAALVARLATAPLLAGCGPAGSSPAAGTAASGPASPSGGPGWAAAEPSPAAAQAPAEAADSGRATDARTAALAVALRPADLGRSWAVQANPVPDASGLISRHASLAGICEGTFPSEGHRTAKYPVVGLDPRRTPLVESEAISYDGAAAAEGALQELRTAFAHCTAGDRTVVARPRVEGLAADAVVVEYELAGGQRQEVLAQARGAVVSVLLAEGEATAAHAAQSIAARLDALPAAAVGG